MDPIYHLTTEDEWAAAAATGEYRATSLANEGFIHASTIAQLEGSANRFFDRYSRVALLKINPTKLNSQLIWEESSHSATPFPHIYGPLNVDAVTEVVFWSKSGEGKFSLPEPPDQLSPTCRE